MLSGRPQGGEEMREGAGGGGGEGARAHGRLEGGCIPPTYHRSRLRLNKSLRDRDRFRNHIHGSLPVLLATITTWSVDYITGGVDSDIIKPHSHWSKSKPSYHRS